MIARVRRACRCVKLGHKIMAKWIDIAYPEPEFDTVPPLSSTDYATRVATVQAEMVRRGLDLLVVYADREHFANLAWLTGYDPRFEEALLLVGSNGQPWLLVGNEGWGYATLKNKSGAKLVKCATFSLQGQPRDGQTLKQILEEIRLARHEMVGLVGLKSYDVSEGLDSIRSSDLPAYIVDLLRSMVEESNVSNQTDLLIHPSTGLRVSGRLTRPHDIALFEQAQEETYAGAIRLMLGLKPGVFEHEAAHQLGYSGNPPLSYHIAIGFGADRVAAGLGSPDSTSSLKISDPVTFGFGVWGGNTARTGIAVVDESELPAEAKDYVEGLAEPYLRCLRDWYKALRVGVTGGEVYEAVKWFVEDPKFGVGLNPGHLIHLDEWPSTPFYSGSKDVLHSGVFIQCDIIPAPGPPFHGIHTEDGLALANAALREELGKEYPAVAARIERRRRRMIDELGFELSPDVLPLCSAQGCVCPFLLNPTRVLTLK